MTNYPDRVLAVYPTRTGFGWVLLEGQDSPIDWGVASVSRDRNAGCLARIDALIDEYRPTSLVLEEFDGTASRRAPRIQNLSTDILNLAHAKYVETHVHARADIKAVFEEAGAKTRYQIARAIALRLQEFAHLLPPRRKIWLPEDPRMGLFSAAAVALTHYALGDRNSS